METKQRHGCLSAWIILMIIGNSVGALAPLLGDLFKISYPNGSSNIILLLTSLCAVLAVISSLLLYNWKKLGFWGTIIASVGVCTINIITGKGVDNSILIGLAGIVTLYVVLQLEKGEKSGWSNLE